MGATVHVDDTRPETGIVRTKVAFEMLLGCVVSIFLRVVLELEWYVMPHAHDHVRLGGEIEIMDFFETIPGGFIQTAEDSQRRSHLERQLIKGSGLGVREFF